MRPFLLILAISSALACAGEESYVPTVKTKVLLRTARTANGAPLSFPGLGGEVAGLEVAIPAGTSTGWHTHAHSGFAYVAAGELRVTLPDSSKHVYRRGDAFAEVVNTLHEGTALGQEDVKLIAFFLADSGRPVSEKPAR